MRVISGVVRGRRLKTVKGLDTRPTSDRIKENLFNILGQDIVGTRFLDLFAGSGAIGIEALSRGATEAVFVERSRSAALVLKNNLEHTGLQGPVMVLDAFRALEVLARQERQFDMVFLDPPYYKELAAKALHSLDVGSLLAAQALVIAEVGRKEDIPGHLLNLVLTRKETYGDTCLAFFRVREDMR